MALPVESGSLSHDTVGLGVSFCVLTHKVLSRVGARALTFRCRAMSEHLFNSGSGSVTSFSSALTAVRKVVQVRKGRTGRQKT